MDESALDRRRGLGVVFFGRAALEHRLDEAQREEVLALERLDPLDPFGERRNRNRPCCGPSSRPDAATGLRAGSARSWRPARRLMRASADIFTRPGGDSERGRRDRAVACEFIWS
jgi:hypothetical protein